MTRRGFSVGARIAAIAVAGALLVPGVGHARIDPECGRGGKPIEAQITQPAGGQLTVFTAATGPVALDAAGASVVVSTTGTVPVTIEYSCFTQMTLTVTKNDPVAGPQISHVTSWEDPQLNGDDPDAPCVESSVSTIVEIGFDGGDYDFTITGEGCNGGPIVPVSDGRFVGDPPLGI